MNIRKSTLITIFFCISITACTSRKQVYMSKDQILFNKNPEMAILEKGNIERVDSSKYKETENLIGRIYFATLQSGSEKIRETSDRKAEVQFKRNSASNSSSIQKAENFKIIITKDGNEKNQAKSDKKRMKPWLIVLLILLGVTATILVTYSTLWIILTIKYFWEGLSFGSFG